MKQGIKEFHRKYVLNQTDNAPNNVVVVCRLHYINTLKQDLSGTRTYQETSTEKKRSLYRQLSSYVLCGCNGAPRQIFYDVFVIRFHKIPFKTSVVETQVLVLLLSTELS